MSWLPGPCLPMPWAFARRLILVTLSVALGRLPDEFSAGISRDLPIALISQPASYAVLETVCCGRPIPRKATLQNCCVRAQPKGRDVVFVTFHVQTLCDRECINRTEYEPPQLRNGSTGPREAHHPGAQVWHEGQYRLFFELRAFARRHEARGTPRRRPQSVSYALACDCVRMYAANPAQAGTSISLFAVTQPPVESMCGRPTARRLLLHGT